MSRKKARFSVPAGGSVVCGSRMLTLNDVSEAGVADVTLTIVQGETVQLIDPTRPDQPWVGDDPGEGPTYQTQQYVRIGHKIRVGNFRQFRIMSWSGTMAEIVVIGPASEID